MLQPHYKALETLSIQPKKRLQRFSQNGTNVIVWMVVLNLLFAGVEVAAQKQVLYVLPKGKLFTTRQLDSTKLAMSDILKKNKMGNLSPVVDVVREYTSGDTLYKVVNIGAKDLNEEKKLQQYIGKPLTAFSFFDLNDNPIRSSKFLGKPLVINLWYTSCGPCIAEIPGLNKMKKKFTGVNFVAMTYETKEHVQSFIAKRSFDFLHIAGIKDYVETLQMGYPTTLFIDKKGVIKDLLVGSSVQGGLDEVRFISSLQKIM